jgi:hypothetical protein
MHAVWWRKQESGDQSGRCGRRCVTSKEVRKSIWDWVNLVAERMTFSTLESDGDLEVLH